MNKKTPCDIYSEKKVMELLFLYFILVISSASLIQFDSELNEHWENFKKTYNKSYHSEEEITRRLIFEEKVADIVKHNIQADLGLHSYTKGINEYSDMSQDEISKSLTRCKLRGLESNNGSLFLEPFSEDSPDMVDWVAKGLVTPVKNQNKCGSSWAFSATGALEGQHKRRSGHLVSLSEQNLMDCSRRQGNKGCSGGWFTQAWDYVRKNKGIDSAKTYPYVGKDRRRCRYKKKYIAAKATGYVSLVKGNEKALKKAVAAIGPISVAIDASHSSFHSYKSGIYNEKSCRNSEKALNHCVLVVGYGTENGNDYWLVKNSWGRFWGKKGYIKMARNNKNQCGIATAAAYPLV